MPAASVAIRIVTSFLMKRSINLCEHSEDLSDDTKTQEIIPIKAQRIFVLKRLGDDEEAAKIAKEIKDILGTTNIDAATRKLAEKVHTPYNSTLYASLTFHRRVDLPLVSVRRRIVFGVAHQFQYGRLECHCVRSSNTKSADT